MLGLQADHGRSRRHLTWSLAVLTQLLAASACVGQRAPSSGAPAPNAVAPGGPRRDTLLSLRHIEGPRYRSPLRAVITDSVTLRRVWAAVGAPGYSAAGPRVDFSKEMVIYAALGSQPTTGWGIRVDSVSSTVERIATVFVTVTIPEGCVVGLAFTQPVDAVVVRYTRQTPLVRFAEQIDARGCPPPRFPSAPSRRP